MLAYMLTTFKYKGTLSIYATTLIFTPWLLPVAVNMDEHSIPAKKKKQKKGTSSTFDIYRTTPVILFIYLYTHYNPYTSHPEEGRTRRPYPHASGIIPLEVLLVKFKLCICLVGEIC
jgi:hypothetical protein